jgi:hypothetical protein
LKGRRPQISFKSTVALWISISDQPPARLTDTNAWLIALVFFRISVAQAEACASKRKSSAFSPISYSNAQCLGWSACFSSRRGFFAIS